MIPDYKESDSFINSLDPRIKLIFVIIFVITTLFIKSFTGYIFLGIIILLPLIFSGFSPGKMIKSFSPFIVLFILTFTFHFLLTPGEIIFEAGVIKGTVEGAMNGAIYSTRIALMILAAILLAITTSPVKLSESVSGIFRKFKSPTTREIPMIMILVLRFIPFMIREGKRIIMAQKARGASLKLGKELVTFLFPIFNSALNRSDELAMALHAKGYEPGSDRLTLESYNLELYDYFFLIYSLIPVVIVLYFS